MTVMPGIALADTINVVNDQSGTTVVTGDTGVSTQDTVTITNSSIDSISTLTDVDTVTITNSTIGNTGTAIDLGTGNDSLTFNSGTINGEVRGNDGNDTLTILDGTLQQEVFGMNGDDIITMSGGTAAALLGDGTFSGGTVITTGNDTITVTGGTVTGNVSGRGGNDVIRITGGLIQGDVRGDGTDSFGNTSTGNDTITITGGTISDDVIAGSGDDTITISGGSIGDDVEGGTGSDTITVSGGTIGGDVAGDNLPVTDDPATGSFNDTITINGGYITESVLGGSGDDTIIVNGGTIAIDLGGDGFTDGTEATVPGNDTIIINGGIVSQGIFGNSGTDSVTMNGGTVAGGISTAETVTLTGGTLSGNVSGLTSLTIDDSSDSTASLSIEDNTSFFGTSATGTIQNSTLGTGYAFSGFTSLNVNNASLGVASGDALIDSVVISNGSTVTVASGSSSLRRTTGTGFGNLSVSNSTFSFINGQTGDVLQIEDLTISNATLGTDVNVAAGTGDQLLVNGTVTTSGSGTLLVNSTDGTLTSQTQVIALSPVSGETAATTADASLSSYTIETTGTAGLNTYALGTGSSGGIYLITTQNMDAVGQGVAPKVAIDSRPPSVISREVSNLTGDAIDDLMGNADYENRPGTQLTPLFGIFASATAGRFDHDGFDVDSATGTIAGPEFSSSEFSALVSLEYDISKGFDLSGPVHAKAGIFAGYGESQVDIGGSSYLTSLGFGNAGDGRNQSGVIGGYGLASYGTNYALLAGTGFFGTTSVNNDVLNSTGDYNTSGYAVSGSVGRIFPFAEKYRFDMRASALWTEFYGDSFTDSADNNFGDSKVAFGAVKFQPGVYTSFTLEDITLTPFVRGEIATRFGYENEAVIQGTKFTFDDDDFSASLAVGSTAAVSERLSLKFEAASKFSEDSTSFTGKFGLKFKLGG